MTYISSALDLAQHLRTESVSIAQVTSGDIILADGVIFFNGALLVDSIEQISDNPATVVIRGTSPTTLKCPNTAMVRRVVREALKKQPAETLGAGWPDMRAKLKELNQRYQIVGDWFTQRGLSTGLRLAKGLMREKEGFCDHCALPWGKHTSHDPEFEVREGERVSVLTKVRPGSINDRKALIRQRRINYRRALKRLTEGELMAMPLPTMRFHITCLQNELQNRIDTKPPERTRYTQLMDDSTYMEDLG